MSDARTIPAPRRLLLISGSLRAGSTNTAVVLTARALAPDEVEPEIYEGMALLPHFNPDDDPYDGSAKLHPAVVDLRARVAAADAILLSTPEYAGALPGSFKNVLDWTVGGAGIEGKPVAWINASSSPTKAADAHASLRRVLGFIGVEIVEDACVHVPVPRTAVGDDGLIRDDPIRDAIAATLARVVQHLA